MTVKKTIAGDGIAALYQKYYANKPSRLKRLDVLRTNDEIARNIFRLRTAAGLTQMQLAKVVGTTASVISRLEDADYEGHSLTMLRRIAQALDQRVEIRFVPIRKSA